MKWEYFTKDLYSQKQSPEEQAKILNHFGEQSWELVSVDNSVAYLKRPISEKTPISISVKTFPQAVNDILYKQAYDD